MYNSWHCSRVPYKIDAPSPRLCLAQVAGPGDGGGVDVASWPPGHLRVLGPGAGAAGLPTQVCPGWRQHQQQKHPHH